MPTDSLPPSDIPAALQGALRLHLGGRVDEAEALYRQILGQDPAHVRALGMLAMLVADRSHDDAEAEALLQRHLALSPNDAASLHRLGRLRARQGDDAAAASLYRRAAEGLPNLAPIFNDLGVSLHRLGRDAEALAALDRALALDPAYGMAHINSGMVLNDLQRFDQAAEAQIAALALAPDGAWGMRAAALHNLVKAVRQGGGQAAAQAACDRVLAAQPTDSATVDELAALLDGLARPGEAQALRNAMARRAGVRRDGPAAGGGEATLLVLGGVGAGHTPIRYLVDKQVFAIQSVALLSPDQPDAPLGHVDFDSFASVDVVFNTLGEADKHGGQFDNVAAVCARLGKPVLNPPAAILRTGRDQAPVLFGDIPDMVTPPVRWTTPGELGATAIDHPQLVRPAGDHGGDNLVLLRNDADRDAYLQTPPPAGARLLLTRFHDFRSPDGGWRKYRLIFVDRKIYPYHLAIGEDWLVHYWRADMSIAPWKKAEEEGFMADWRAVFGERAARAAETAAQRLDLDYAGMDCALLADGQLLLFEANACMHVHLDEPAAAFPYKHRHVPAIRAAFSAMVRERARGGLAPP